MKKNIIIILIGFLLPLKINALTGSVSLKCNSTNLVINTSTSCTLSGTSNEEVSAISAKLNSSGNIIISNISTSSIWQGDGSNGSIDLYTDTNKKGTFSIATFDVKATSSVGTGNINISNINFSNALFEEYSIPSKTLTINVIKQNSSPKPSDNSSKPVISNKLNNDATLKSLTIKPADINFNTNTINYNVVVSYDIKNIEIKAEVNNSKSSVIIPQNRDLKIGNNKFEVKVTAEDGTVKIYTINITREERKLSNNSKLKKIAIANHKIEFDKNKYSYDLKNIEESTLDIEIIPEDTLADYKIYGNEDISSNDAIVIEVIAEDKSTSHYIIYVNNTKNTKETKKSYFCGEYIYFYTIIMILILIILGLIFYKKKNKNEMINFQK